MAKTTRKTTTTGPGRGTPGVKGSFSSGLVAPLDYVILEMLPDQGSMVGYHNIGMTSKAVASKTKVAGSIAAGRLYAMRVLGLVTPVQLLPVSQGKGWQITDAGKKTLKEWKGGEQSNDS